MTKQQLLIELEKQIMEELANCIPAATPMVCEAIQTVEGYQQVLSQIVILCLDNQITPRQALPELESLLSEDV